MEGGARSGHKFLEGTEECYQGASGPFIASRGEPGTCLIILSPPAGSILMDSRRKLYICSKLSVLMEGDMQVEFYGAFPFTLTIKYSCVLHFFMCFYELVSSWWFPNTHGTRVTTIWRMLLASGAHLLTNPRGKNSWVWVIAEHRTYHRDL